MHPDRMPRTMELIYTSLRFTYAILMRLKHALACRRPHEYSPQIQPMISCPLHCSWPSGHSTEGFVFAHIMVSLLSNTKGDGSLMPLWTNQLMRQASRIAINRTVAGLHFPVDSAAGALLGLTLAEYLVGRFTGQRKYRSCSFNGQRYPTRGDKAGVNTDFHWEDFYDANSQKLRIADGNVGRYAKLGGTAHPLGDESLALRWLWNKAKAEWDFLAGNASAKRRSNGRARG